MSPMSQLHLGEASTSHSGLHLHCWKLTLIWRGVLGVRLCCRMGLTKVPGCGGSELGEAGHNQHRLFALSIRSRRSGEWVKSQ